MIHVVSPARQLLVICASQALASDGANKGRGFLSERTSLTAPAATRAVAVKAGLLDEAADWPKRLPLESATRPAYHNHWRRALVA